MLEWYRLGFDDQALRTEVSELCDELLGPDAYQTVTYAQLVGDLQRPPAELDLAFADACTDLCPGRFFIVDYPADQAALARLRQDDPAWARRFELVIDGVEVANGYFELTDVQEHRRRFSADAQARRARDLPDREVDPHLLAALEHGLPDCAGVALGFDRLVMLALGLTRLEQVLAFTR